MCKCSYPKKLAPFVVAWSELVPPGKVKDSTASFTFSSPRNPFPQLRLPSSPSILLQLLTFISVHPPSTSSVALDFIITHQSTQTRANFPNHDGRVKSQVMDRRGKGESRVLFKHTSTPVYESYSCIFSFQSSSRPSRRPAVSHGIQSSCLKAATGSRSRT